MKNVYCVNCGTNLEWWLKRNKRNKVYRDDADDLYCTKKCFKEYAGNQSLKEITKVENL